MTLVKFPSFFIAFLAAMPFLMAQALPVGSSSGSADHLFVSLPPGGCSLRVHSDGSGVIHYGAAPQAVRVPSGSFDVAQMVELLSANLQPWSHRDLLDNGPASVVLPGGNESFLNTDTDVIRSLLDQAWKKRLPPDTAWFEHGQQDQDWVKRACGFQ